MAYVVFTVKGQTFTMPADELIELIDSLQQTLESAQQRAGGVDTESSLAPDTDGFLTKEVVLRFFADVATIKRGRRLWAAICHAASTPFPGDHVNFDVRCTSCGLHVREPCATLAPRGKRAHIGSLRYEYLVSAASLTEHADEFTEDIHQVGRITIADLHLLVDALKLKDRT